MNRLPLLFRTLAALAAGIFLLSALVAGTAQYRSARSAQLDELRGRLSDHESRLESLESRTEDLEAKDEEQDSNIETAGAN